MANYKDLIEKSVKKEIEVLGKETAVKTAHEVEGLKVTEDGEVAELEREGKRVLEELVKKYQEVGGSVSASLIAREVEAVVDDTSMLPEILAKRIRAEEFASAI